MLDEQVRAPDLALVGAGRAVPREGGGGVVVRHVGFEGVGVGAFGGLPAGGFGRGVEVVGQVFGVGVADLPAGGEACVGLGGV